MELFYKIIIFILTWIFTFSIKKITGNQRGPRPNFPRKKGPRKNPSLDQVDKDILDDLNRGRSMYTKLKLFYELIFLY